MYITPSSSLSLGLSYQHLRQQFLTQRPQRTLPASSGVLVEGGVMLATRRGERQRPSTVDGTAQGEKYDAATGIGYRSLSIMAAISDTETPDFVGFTATRSVVPQLRNLTVNVPAHRFLITTYQ